MYKCISNLFLEFTPFFFSVFRDANTVEKSSAGQHLKSDQKSHRCNNVVPLQTFTIPLNYFPSTQSLKKILFMQLFLPCHMPCAHCFLLLSLVQISHLSFHLFETAHKVPRGNSQTANPNQIKLQTNGYTTLKK